VTSSSSCFVSQLTCGIQNFRRKLQTPVNVNNSDGEKVKKLQNAPEMNAFESMDFTNHLTSCRFCFVADRARQTFPLDQEIARKFFDFTNLEVNKSLK
jgi:hypothetical protein